MQQKQPHIKLLLVGPEEPDLDPLKEATRKDIQENEGIIAVGYQEDVRPFFALSDVLVFPSYREGFPNVVLQAGAMGLPSIVTNINGCNEIVKEGSNGLIVKPKDEASLAAAMEHILDPALRKQLAENARPNIESKYKREVLWQALLAEYQALEKECL